MGKLAEIKNRANQTLADSRWKQIVSRDASANGQFYYSVLTTGIYCRPSCGARTPRPENIDFHATIEAAEAAGFRACKRCKPKQPFLYEVHAEMVSNVCRMIEQSEKVPSLAQLAEYVRLSVYHFHRIFKTITGLTPKAYADAHKAKSMRKCLENKTTITDAIYEAGYGSNSRFYESSSQVLGMKPSVYRKGGVKTDIHFALGECSLGSILVAMSAIGVCAIALDDNPEKLIKDLQDQFPYSNLIGGNQQFESMVAEVVGFVEAPHLGCGLPLDIQGTVFQQRVWQALREIPCGTTATYSELASKIGNPNAVRAVASACAANKLAVAIPCHRVIRNDGSISGYRWGVERKQTLLFKEAKYSERNSI